MPIAKLVRETGLAKSTLTAMLSRMESSGLITRCPGEQDGRQVIIKLTPRARGLEEKYDQVSQRMNSLFYKGMTQEEAYALDALLDRVLANLQELL